MLRTKTSTMSSKRSSTESSRDRRDNLHLKRKMMTCLQLRRRETREHNLSLEEEASASRNNQGDKASKRDQERRTGGEMMNQHPLTATPSKAPEEVEAIKRNLRERLVRSHRSNQSKPPSKIPLSNRRRKAK
jgi:hypothetical protein